MCPSSYIGPKSGSTRLPRSARK